MSPFIKRMNTHKKVVGLLTGFATLSLTLAACTSISEKINSAHPPLDESHATSEGVQQVITANNQFAIDTFKNLTLQSDSLKPVLNSDNGEWKNTFFSPYSISSAAAMLYAEGENSANFQQLFHYPSLDILLNNNPVLFNQLNQQQEKLQLNTVNDIWIQQGKQLPADYVTNIKNSFGSKINEVDFVKNPKKVEQRINQYIGEQTKQMIPKLIPDGRITKDTTKVLTNVIYFKGRWSNEFIPDYTKDKPFYGFDNQSISDSSANPDVSVKNIPIMWQSDTFGFVEDENIQAIKLNYLHDNQSSKNDNTKRTSVSMTVILPKENNPQAMQQLINSLTNEQLQTWQENMKYEKVNLSLPKLNINNTYNKEQLFGSSPSSFDKLAKGNLSLQLFHKAILQVDEEGTVAIGATADMAKSTSEEEPVPKDFNANHPFIVMIATNDDENKSKGVILFMGLVNVLK